MALTVFGVTYSTVRSTRFPSWNSFSARSAFTDTEVAALINEEAADLAGKLYAENITASSITTPANEVGYTWCAKTLALMVAVRILRDVSASDPALAQAYQRELDTRFKLLASQGATALGDSSLSTGDSDPDGPTSHVSEFGLTTDDPADMSDTVPALRKGDKL